MSNEPCGIYEGPEAQGWLYELPVYLKGLHVAQGEIHRVELSFSAVKSTDTPSETCTREYEVREMDRVDEGWSDLLICNDFSREPRLVCLYFIGYNEQGDAVCSSGSAEEPIKVAFGKDQDPFLQVPGQPEAMKCDPTGCLGALMGPSWGNYSAGSITIVPKVFFEPGSVQIDPDKEPILNDVASTMKKDSSILHVHLPGHADKKEPDPVGLSLKRSQAVADYLIAEGVEPSRLSTAGYGGYCPLDPDDDEVALQKNRRVDIWLLETTSGCTHQWFVCDEAVDAGLVPEEAQRYLPDSDYCDSLP
jgi:outer membrane protein OmpA-like peptidoglycan-associated protein